MTPPETVAALSQKVAEKYEELFAECVQGFNAADLYNLTVEIRLEDGTTIRQCYRDGELRMQDR